MRLLRNGDHFVLTRCQRGWRCELRYSASTDEQFTDVSRTYETGSRWALLALLKGWLGAKRAKRRIERAHTAGDRPAGLFWTPKGVSLEKRFLTEAAVSNVDAFFDRFARKDRAAK